MLLSSMSSSWRIAVEELVLSSNKIVDWEASKSCSSSLLKFRGLKTGLGPNRMSNARGLSSLRKSADQKLWCLVSEGPIKNKN